MTTVAPVAALLDYGAGNLRSVAKALERSGFRVRISADPASLSDADAIVLPGVGAFAPAAERLRETGLGEAVRDAILRGRPYLGLCLGLQLLFDESDEHGVTAGLGLLCGRVERLSERDSAGAPLRVPHIGWNEVRFSGDHPILESLPPSDYFYFVHSYLPTPTDPSVVIGRCDYGAELSVAVARDNIFAVQFHPEKSQAAGARLLDGFASWVRAC